MASLIWVAAERRLRRGRRMTKPRGTVLRDHAGMLCQLMHACTPSCAPPRSRCRASSCCPGRTARAGGRMVGSRAGHGRWAAGGGTSGERQPHRAVPRCCCDCSQTQNTPRTRATQILPGSWGRRRLGPRAPAAPCTPGCPPEDGERWQGRTFCDSKWPTAVVTP